MPLPFSDHFAFFRQFRQEFKTTGAIAPSSRFLAKALTGPMRKRQTPSRILEVGPGTGAVTRRIVQLLEPEEQFDLVELNQSFATILKNRFENHPAYRRVAENSSVHVCPVQEFETDVKYDYIISGLPLNNFSPELVGEIFDSYFRLLAPGGVLSYFEYMYVRPIRLRISNGEEKQRLKTLDDMLKTHLAHHRFRTSWVFANFPPAWAQHLRPEDFAGEAADEK